MTVYQRAAYVSVSGREGDVALHCGQEALVDVPCGIVREDVLAGHNVTVENAAIVRPTSAPTRKECSHKVWLFVVENGPMVALGARILPGCQSVVGTAIKQYTF